jgi:hypothetical protein
MTVLVAGNAAHFDLILQADRQPGASEVATLTGGAGYPRDVVPGGRRAHDRAGHPGPGSACQAVVSPPGPHRRYQ